MDEILKCYRVLDIAPGTPLKAIKKAYRSLVKKWHPDQFADNPLKRQEAEDKLKEINLAFERIQQAPIVLPKTSGRSQPSGSTDGAARPRARRSPPRQRPYRTPRAQGRSSEPAAKPRQATPQATRADSKPKKSNQNDALARERKAWQIGLAIAATISFGWFAFYLWTPPKKQRSAARSNQRARSSPQSQQNPIRVSPSRPIARDPASASTPIPSAQSLSELASVLRSTDNNFLESSPSARVSSEPRTPSPSRVNSESVSENQESFPPAGQSKVPSQSRRNPAEPVKARYDPNAAEPILTEIVRDVIAVSSASPSDPLPTPEEIAEADFQRGLDHANGRGVVKDLAQAAHWYQQAAEAGHVEAQKNLGFLYATGKGVEKDENEASKWMGRSASKGNSSASLVDGLLALAQKQSAREIPVDSTDIAATSRLREEGHSSLYKELMNRSSETQTNSNLQPAEPPAGLDPQAQFERGLKYAKGEGVQQDFSESAKWYRRAAEAGHAEAQKSLGFLYATGRGVGQDYAEAERWFRKATEKGAVGAAVNKASVSSRDSESSDETGSERSSGKNEN